MCVWKKSQCRNEIFSAGGGKEKGRGSAQSFHTHQLYTFSCSCPSFETFRRFSILWEVFYFRYIKCLFFRYRCLFSGTSNACFPAHRQTTNSIQLKKQMPFFRYTKCLFPGTDAFFPVRQMPFFPVHRLTANSIQLGQMCVGWGVGNAVKRGALCRD